MSEDAPALDIAYKLTEYAGKGRLKLSSGKRTLPGRKQVFRRSEGGCATGDVIARAEERVDGAPLLAPVMRGGERLAAAPSVPEIRARTAEALAALPERVQDIAPADPPYPVEITPALEQHEREVRAAIRGAG